MKEHAGRSVDRETVLVKPHRNEDFIGDWTKGHAYGFLANILFIPQDLREVELKRNGKNSKTTQAMPWLPLAAFNQVYSDY